MNNVKITSKILLGLPACYFCGNDGGLHFKGCSKNITLCGDCAKKFQRKITGAMREAAKIEKDMQAHRKWLFTAHVIKEK